MRTLDEARATCDSYLPGLLDRLAELSLQQREAAGSVAIDFFRAAGGPGLLIPKEYAGLAASPLDAVRTLRAIGSYAPSLAVATTMHHFSVATLFTLAESIKNSGMEWALLEGIATKNLLVSSAFAEGRTAQGILAPTMIAQPGQGGYIVNGSKKPCSLSMSMNLFSASVAIAGEDRGPGLAFILIPAETDGISIHPFWASDILAGAESDEVRLEDVFVDERLVMRTELGAHGELDQLQTVGLIWFEMLISSCYLGMASALVERVFDSAKASTAERTSISIRLETATNLLEGVARLLGEDVDNNALARVLVSRYAAQDAINDAVRASVEALGGMAFITSPEVAYFASASQCLAFHPPSRSTSVGPLDAYFTGAALTIG